MVLSRNGQTDSKAVYIYVTHSLGSLSLWRINRGQEAPSHTCRLSTYSQSYISHNTAAFTTQSGRQIQIFLMRNHKFPQSLKKSSLHSVTTLSDHITFHTQSNASYDDKQRLFCFARLQQRDILHQSQARHLLCSV